MKNEIENVFENQIIFIEPNKKYNIEDIEFETFLSYNRNKQFHPKENNWVGYKILINGESVAIVGDSDATSELKQIKTDILLIPIGGTYTMTAQEAAYITNIIKPKIVIPTHYGDVVGDKNLGENFKQMINDDIKCELKI